MTLMPAVSNRIARHISLTRRYGPGEFNVADRATKALNYLNSENGIGEKNTGLLIDKLRGIEVANPRLEINYQYLLPAIADNVANVKALVVGMHSTRGLGQVDFQELSYKVIDRTMDALDVKREEHSPRPDNATIPFVLLNIVIQEYAQQHPNVLGEEVLRFVKMDAPKDLTETLPLFFRKKVEREIIQRSYDRDGWEQDVVIELPQIYPGLITETEKILDPLDHIVADSELSVVSTEEELAFYQDGAKVQIVALGNQDVQISLVSRNKDTFRAEIALLKKQPMNWKEAFLILFNEDDVQYSQFHSHETYPNVGVAEVEFGKGGEKVPLGEYGIGLGVVQ